MPVFQCSCGIINWPQAEINKRDIKTRRLLTIHKMFYKNQCILRMYLPRREAGSGLMELNQAYRMTTVGLAKYVKSATDYQIQFIRKHKDNKPEKVILYISFLFQTGVHQIHVNVCHFEWSSLLVDVLPFQVYCRMCWGKSLSSAYLVKQHMWIDYTV